eukprot:1161105-Pelagomonas_calceolata.AAC.1
MFVCGCWPYSRKNGRVHTSDMHATSNMHPSLTHPTSNASNTHATSSMHPSLTHPTCMHESGGRDSRQSHTPYTHATSNMHPNLTHPTCMHATGGLHRWRENCWGCGRASRGSAHQ